MKILILTYIYTDFDPRYGGEARVVWETTNALARNGVEVFVVTSMKNFRTALHPNITLYTIPFAKKNFLNFDQGELLKIFLFSIPLLFIKRIDIIHHLPTNGPDLFARFKFGRIFTQSADPGWDYENQKFGKDLALDRSQKIREAGYDNLPMRMFEFWPRIARRLFKIIGVDEKYPKGTDIFFYRTLDLYSILKNLRPESKLVYVPNGVDVKKFSPNNLPLFGRLQNGLRFLHVGNISRRKGTYYLLKAFISIIPMYPESELFLVGSGNADFVGELKKMSMSYPQIHFYENISDEELPKVYTSADVFCLASLGGPMLHVLAEAMASGLPVIATKSSGNGEVIEKYDAGFVVEPADENDLAQAMVQLIENRDLVRSKGKNALVASRFFSWDHIAHTLINSYKDILRAR